MGRTTHARCEEFGGRRLIDTGRAICDAVPIPVIGDADTGYGNALNVKRTISGYAAAGFPAYVEAETRYRT